MNIEELREYCLSLPGVTEATPFEKFSRGKFTILVFYVSGHMFCYFNIDDFTAITLKGNPQDIVELKERYQTIGEPFNGNKRHWMSVEMNSDVNDTMLKQLVRASYNLVKGNK
jgi:predicted DNA-binding protein (MmcQ/YjbR family)